MLQRINAVFHYGVKGTVKYTEYDSILSLPGERRISGGGADSELCWGEGRRDDGDAGDDQEGHRARLLLQG